MKRTKDLGRQILGTIYMNNMPVKPRLDYIGGPVTIGNTVSGKELSWCQMEDGSLIAADVFIRDIPFDALEKNRLVKGCSVSIDGKNYICRLLKAGADEWVENEWDAALQKHGDADSIWHALDCYFWGQETPDAYPKDKVIRGFQSPEYWGSASPDQKVGVGWRPILIPAEFKSINDDLISQFVTVHGPEGDISGTVSGFSDYDLLLVRDEPLDPGESKPLPKSSWYATVGDEIAIDRASIDYIT